jgi:3D (Asp-Asp-Asp) domain-containing protein
VRAHLLLAALALSACAGGQRWVNEVPESLRGGGDAGWKTLEPEAARRDPRTGASIGAPAPGEPTDEAGQPAGGTALTAGSDLFRNTYYDFPRDRAADRNATVFDAACAPIAQVSQEFHDQVCVQGSGRLANGDTVSFARRDCACAAVCPRTGQKICFERLDARAFPAGRGATGRAITPLRTVAVDPAVIPLGTPLFVADFVGLPMPDGGTHDGCFLAEDRGIKVVGRHVDIFTGDPATTSQWNSRVPSNRGVTVKIGDPRCARR